MNPHNCIDTINTSRSITSVAAVPAMPSPLTWRKWAADGVSLITAQLRTMFTTAVEAQRRAEQRKQLLELDDRMLKDIGITREQAVREASKPFWME